jgi:hypothetical protein
MACYLLDINTLIFYVVSLTVFRCLYRSYPMKHIHALVVLLIASNGALADEWWVYRNAHCEPAAYTPQELVNIKLSKVELDQPENGWMVLSGKDEPDSMIYFGRSEAACLSLGQALQKGLLPHIG